VQDPEIAHASARRAHRRWHIARAGLAVTGAVLEIVWIAAGASADRDCTSFFPPLEQVALCAFVLAGVAFLTLVGFTLAAAIPRGAQIGGVRRWNPGGVAIGSVGLTAMLLLLWYAISLPDTTICPPLNMGF